LSTGDDVPGHWMHETSGVLRDAVQAYYAPELDPHAPPMTGEQIAVMRAYLRIWINAPLWRGPLIDVLRTQVNEITTRGDLDRWLARAVDQGIDPL
jgi:hypothetical protein